MKPRKHHVPCVKLNTKKGVTIQSYHLNWLVAAGYLGFTFDCNTSSGGDFRYEQDRSLSTVSLLVGSVVMLSCKAESSEFFLEAIKVLMNSFVSLLSPASIKL